MSSDLQSIIGGLFTNNYASLAMVTVVVYDYILTLPSEIEYIWGKPWTWVSTLFVLIRYLGIYDALAVSFPGTTFMPGPHKSIPADNSIGTGIIVTSDWAFVVFMAAADLVMALRVYALWNQSRIILGILLLFYVVEVLIQIVCTAIFDNPNTYSPVAIHQILNYSVCYATTTTITPYLKYTIINTFLYDALLFALALIPTVRQSIAMYRATKQWQPNRYMSLIAREGVFYIFLNLLNNITNVVEKLSANPLTTPWLVMLGLLGVVSLYPIIPRFVLGVRELYAKDSLGRVQGIDSGFGLSSRAMADGDAVVSAIAFADAGGGHQGREDDDEIQLGQVGEASC